MLYVYVGIRGLVVAQRYAVRQARRILLACPDDTETRPAIGGGIPVYRSCCLGRTWLPLLGLVLAFATPCAPAVPLLPGDTVLSGTTSAARPELVGVV